MLDFLGCLGAQQLAERKMAMTKQGTWMPVQAAAAKRGYFYLIATYGSPWCAAGREMAATKKAGAGAPVKGGKKKASSFVIDCSKPVEDKIMEIGAFEKFLVDKIKVDNKPGAPALPCLLELFCAWEKSVRSLCRRGGAV